MSTFAVKSHKFNYTGQLMRLDVFRDDSWLVKSIQHDMFRMISNDGGYPDPYIDDPHLRFIINLYVSSGLTIDFQEFIGRINV